MTNLTYADICMGYGGATQGAIDAGLVPIWGVENNLDIVNVAKQNHKHYIFRDDVRNFADYCGDLGDSLNWLHASLPCTTATVVNGKKESQEDIDLAKAVCRAIEVLKPEYFSLENVAGYCNYLAFTTILLKLEHLGYVHDARILDCSYYGVPQDRKRLFLIASKNHSASGWSDRLKPVEKKVSWYDAIADLIPILPEWHLTDSQKERYELAIKKDPTKWMGVNTFAIQNAGNRKKDGEQNHTIRFANEPIWTMRAMSGKKRPNPHQVTLVIDGKVLRPTIECYARWQSFPDSYQFSGDFKLDMKGIGNAVPPLMFSQIVRSVLNA